MKRFLGSLAILIALHGCATVTTKERSWSFVTAVGGLALAAPVHVGNRWELPVRADVSGLRAITNEPTTMNSGLVCDATRADVKGRDILIVIVTTMPHGNATSACPAAKLGALDPGQYNILYGPNRAEGVKLGTIDVAL
jgi:hypothetical protein